MTTKQKTTQRAWVPIVAGCLLVVVGIVVVPYYRWHKAGVDYKRYRPIVVAAAERHGIDPNLALAVVRKESNFDAGARGQHKELGLMQVTSGAALDWQRVNKRKLRSNAELLDPELNVEVGVWYLAQAMRQFAGHKYQVELALSQYNAGRRRALKWAQRYEQNLPESIPISSTRNYILRVQEFRARYQADTRK